MDHVTIEQESFIPVTRSDLYAAFRRHLNTSSASDSTQHAWYDLCENMGIILAIHYNSLTTKLHEVWAGDRPMTAADELATMRAIDKMLSASQYHALPGHMHDSAVSESYDFRLPMKIQWEKYDTDFLQKFYDDRGGYVPTVKGEGIPNFARHVYVAFRGLGMIRKTGYFFSEKIDCGLELLVSKLTNQPVETSTSPRRATHKPKSSTTSIFSAKTIKRRSLHSIVTEQGYWRTFFKTVEIQEPMFRDVILIYKPLENFKMCSLLDSVSNVSSGFHLGSLSKYSATNPLIDTIASNNPQGPNKVSSRTRIQIEKFQDIPCGDLEILFPYKGFAARSIDTLKFTLRLCMITFLVVFGFSSVIRLYHAHKNSEKIDSNILSIFIPMVTLVPVLLHRLYHAVEAFRTEKITVARQVESWQEEKRVSRGKGVVTVLADEVQLQELKEIILAYFFLWQYGAMTLDELDRSVEKFLKLEFGLESDFEAMDAVRKLLALDMINTQESNTGELKYKVSTTPKQWVEKFPLKHRQLSQ